MSLELKELSSIKVHPEVHAMLRANALCKNVEMNAFCREILHKWAREQHEINSKSDEIARASGLSGITGDWK